MAYTWRSKSGYKVLGTCRECHQTVYGPMRARVLGTIKQCRRCREYDPAVESERAYFEKMDSGYQTDVLGYSVSP